MVYYVAPGIIFSVLEPPYIIYRNPTFKELSNIILNIAAREYPRAGSKQMATYQAVVAQTQSSSKQPIMRTEDRLFDRGWARSAMETRKCGNIYFPKYFMAVRPFFTRNFFQELFGLEGYENLLENFVRCTIRKSRTVSYDPRVFFKKIFLVSMQRMCTLFG